MSRTALALLALLAASNLVAGLVGGLARLGVLTHPLAQALLPHHGALMMAGFFGSVIALERAVALQRGLWVPASAALAGWLLVLLPAPVALAGLAWAASAAGLALLYLWAAHHRKVSLPLAVEASATLALLVGTTSWAMGEDAAARLGWSAFILLTVAGERRELTALANLPTWSRRAFVLLWLALLFSVALARPAPALALPLWWAAALGLAAWLARFDIGLRAWRAPGWPRHTARCLMVGIAWLAVAAALGLARQAAAWHVLWLGFVWAMVFAHAPIMLTALARLRPVYTPWAMAPVALMSLGVALRTAATLAGWPALLAAAAGAQTLALVAFALVMVRALRGR